MTKRIDLSDKLFSFTIPNENDGEFKGKVIRANYEEIDMANARLRILCEEYVSNDIQTEAIAAYSYVGY